MTTIQVSSAMQAAIAAGYVQIVARTRETKNKKVENANRLRAILIPEINIPELPEKFASFVRDQLYIIAKDQLAELWEQNGNEWAETTSDLWTVDSLLTFAARKSESQRLSGELIKTAFADFLSQFDDEKKRDKIRDVLISMAAPKKDCNLKQAEFLRTKIAAHIEDCESAGEEISWVIRAVARKIDDHHAELSQLLAATDAF